MALGLSLFQMSTWDILAFMEYMAQYGMSPEHIVNHLTAIKSLCITYACEKSPFHHQRLFIYQYFENQQL